MTSLLRPTVAGPLAPCPFTWIVLGCVGALVVVAAPGCGGNDGCVPGRVVSCPCPGSGVDGTQACLADGKSYGACVCGGVDAGTFDAGARDAQIAADAGTDDGGGADAGPRSDAGPLTTCIYPSLEGEETPTSGHCEADVAVTCDATSHAMRRSPCGATERCVEVDVMQFAIPSAVPPIPGHTFRWAACVARDAAACSYRGDEGWTPSVAPRCASDLVAETCRMPLPDDFPLNAGTTTGFLVRTACEAEGACRDGRCVLSTTPCATERWECDGIDVVGCAAGDLPARYPCAHGAQCRNTTACSGGASPSASCIPADALAAPDCDPATFTAACGPSGGELICDDGGICWGATQCRCAVTERACLTPDTTCRTFSDPGTGATSAVCAPAESCTSGSRCEGARAIQCDSSGRPSVTDCAALGMTCAASGGRIGCVDGADVCELPGQSCDRDGAIVGCCSDRGAFSNGVYDIPCLPNRKIRATCPSTPGAPPYHCFDGSCST